MSGDMVTPCKAGGSCVVALEGIRASLSCPHESRCGAAAGNPSAHGET